MTESTSEGSVVTVHYWAAARAAAGVGEDRIAVEGPLTLAQVRDRAVELHQGTRLDEVLKACSTLIGDQPVGRADPATVRIRPGDTVEFLPPFAGG